MRKIIFISSFLLLITSCKLPKKYTDVTIDNKHFECVDLNHGIYRDEYDRLYKLSYEISYGKLNFFMVKTRG